MPTTVPADGPEEDELSDAAEARELLDVRDREEAAAVTIEVTSARVVVGSEVVSELDVVSGRVVVGSVVDSMEEKEVEVEVLSTVVVMMEMEEEVSEVLVDSEVDVSGSSEVVGVVEVEVDEVRVREVDVAAGSIMRVSDSSLCVV